MTNGFRNNGDTAMMNELKTACGQILNVNDQTRQHLLAHPEAAELLEEAVAKVTLPDSFLLTTVNMGREIGTNACVKAADVENIHFAVRTGRDVPSRVLPGQLPEPTHLFTVIAGKKEDGSWMLYTGFAGPSAPREPHDRYFADKRDSKEFAESLEFWTKNGLCVSEGWGEVYASTWQAELAKIDAVREKG
jgi:hypothetical protein